MGALSVVEPACRVSGGAQARGPPARSAGRHRGTGPPVRSVGGQERDPPVRSAGGTGQTRVAVSSWQN